MRISVISTYPPRLCGVGVYTADLVEHYCRQWPADAVTLLGADVGGDSVRPVQDGLAADMINEQRPSLVLAQYAYGMYGDDSSQLVEALRQVRAPVVLTLHHVGHPPDPRAAPLPELIAAVDAVVVLSQESHRRLVDEFGLGTANIAVIPHGVELISPPSRLKSRSALGIASDAIVLTTFGLLRPAKGIDQALQVVAAACEQLPGLRYVVAGTPHPGSSPAEFRRHLRADIAAAGLTEVVQIIDRHLENDELHQLLAATDMQLLPYRRLDQTTSGPLLRGLSAGTPFFATPFSHAVELAALGGGLIDNYEPAARAAACLIRVLDDDVEMVAMRDSARRIATGHDWRLVAKLHQQLFHQLWRGYNTKGTR